MRILSFVFLFLISAVIFGQTNSLFDRATGHYADGNFEEAVRDYEKILENGKASAEVYYNLANAYYKLEQVAPSIYYYNKALQLNPGNKDIQNNLLLAKEHTIDVIQSKPKTKWTRFVERIMDVFSFDSWAVIAVIFSVLFMIFGLLYYFNPRTGRKRFFFSLGGMSLIACTLSVIFAFNRYDFAQNNQFAIVFAEQTGVYSEPNLNSSEAFVLHEGTKIKVLDKFNGYSKILLEDGKEGWIADDNIKEL